VGSIDLVKTEEPSTPRVDLVNREDAKAAKFAKIQR